MVLGKGTPCYIGKDSKTKLILTCDMSLPGPYTRIDLATWKRKAQFDFFKDFELPVVNISANVEITHLRKTCTDQQLPFSLASVWVGLHIANQIPEFRTRIVGEEVHEYHQVHAGLTVLLDDDTFLLVTVHYHPDLHTFIERESAAIEAQKQKRNFAPHTRLDMVFFSVLPLVSFTSVSHALNSSPTISVPRIVYGKYFESGDKILMPVAVQVHHALADGFHLGQFYDAFERIMNELGKEEN